MLGPLTKIFGRQPLEIVPQLLRLDDKQAGDGVFFCGSSAWCPAKQAGVDDHIIVGGYAPILLKIKLPVG